MNIETAQFFGFGAAHRELGRSHSSNTGGSTDALYKELWHACAGPLVTLPRKGERVYYFSQGHMEQLEASTHRGLDQQLPIFNLPSKILCKVMNVTLQAEQETDEVYAQIMLIPEQDENEITSPDPPLPEPQRCTVHSFCKTLTASDTSTQGGFSVLRRHADDCLPPLVHMQGIAVGRAVDLTRFDSYEDLFDKFEEMFEIVGDSLVQKKNGKWYLQMMRMTRLWLETIHGS